MQEFCSGSGLRGSNKGLKSLLSWSLFHAGVYFTQDFFSRRGRGGAEGSRKAREEAKVDALNGSMKQHFKQRPQRFHAKISRKAREEAK